MFKFKLNFFIHKHNRMIKHLKLLETIKTEQISCFHFCSNNFKLAFILLNENFLIINLINLKKCKEILSIYFPN